MNVVPLQANLYFIVRMNKSLALAHFQTSFQFIKKVRLTASFFAKRVLCPLPGGKEHKLSCARLRQPKKPIGAYVPANRAALVRGKSVSVQGLGAPP